MSKRLADKSLVIIGGTGGIGLSAARACCDAGAVLVLVGRDPQRGQRASEQLGDRVALHVGDATNPDTAPAAIRLAEATYGRFDGIYHVAGGSGRKQGDGPLHAISDAGWQHTLDLNLSALMYSNRAAVQHFLAKKKPGVVLNMTSVLADSPSPRFFATHTYAASKAAAIGLTKAAAAFYAPQAIRFNCLAPALVDTDLATRAKQNPAILDYIATKHPLDGGRLGRTTDLDEATVFLLSDAARFVTGQVLAIDGGWGLSEGQYAVPD